MLIGTGLSSSVPLRVVACAAVFLVFAVASDVRFHRVPNANHFNFDIWITVFSGKGTGHTAVMASFIMPVRLPDIAHRSMFRAQQTNPVNDPGKRSHTVSPARKTEQEYPITRAIT